MRLEMGLTPASYVDKNLESWQVAAEREIRDKLLGLMRFLNPIERRVIELRYGMGVFEMEMGQVARVLRTNRVRAASIQARALKKLRVLFDR